MYGLPAHRIIGLNSEIPFFKNISPAQCIHLIGLNLSQLGFYLLKHLIGLNDLYSES
jgi:hypothetical protein